MTQYFSPEKVAEEQAENDRLDKHTQFLHAQVMECNELITKYQGQLDTLTRQSEERLSLLNTKLEVPLSTRSCFYWPLAN